LHHIHCPRIPLLFSAVLGLMILFGCNQTTRSRAFYYWKTTYNLTARDGETLDQLGIHTLYIRMFDVIWDKASASPLPTGKISVASNPFAPEVLVPVVFLTQEVMKNMVPSQIPHLARNVVGQIFRQLESFPNASIPQIQMDCDWTPTSKETYFHFLKQIDAEIKTRRKGVALSATIRLHQLRHRRSNGIPPVSRGVLMAYHTTSPTEYSSTNSILDLPTVSGYLRKEEAYPLPLDVAMPVFSWAVQYDDRKQFIRLLRDVGQESVSNNPDWHQESDLLFQASKDTWLNHQRIMSGDLVEFETPTLENLQELSPLLKAHADPKGTVLFFDYHANHIQRITDGNPSKLEAILAAF